MKKVVIALTATVLLLSCKKQQQIKPGDNNDARTASEEATCAINAGTVQQNIRGFGGASIRGWIADLTSDQRTTTFSAGSGIGLSVLRVRVSPNSSDFAAEKPTIDAAKANGAMVIASAWTAPASMKD